MSKINLPRWFAHLASIALLGYLAVPASQESELFGVEASYELRIVISVVLVLIAVISGLGNVVESYNRGKLKSTE